MNPAAAGRRLLAAGLAACAALLLGACATGPGAGMDMAAAQQLLQEPNERMIVVAIANPQIGSAPQAGSTLTLYAATPRYALGTPARETLKAIEREHGLKEVVGWPIRALGLHCAVLEIAPGAAREAVIDALTQDKRVELVQPLLSFDTLTSTAVAPAYNDPYVELQRGFVEIEAGAAHRSSRGAGVLVAVIDTGTDTLHPDLRGRIGVARNFVDADQIAFQRDLHGTQVAGIIAAVADNRQGIVGVAPEARLALYKACWQRAAEGAGARCSSFTLALALAAAIEDGAAVINLSVGGPPDPLLTRLVALALKQGRIVVGALPPDGTAGFPSGIEGVIAVDMAGRTAAPRAGREVLRAPGRDILTLRPGGGYDYESGSSLAAAHVSATAALLLAADPRLPGTTVRALLLRSQGQAAQGESINACSALAELQADAPCAVKRTAVRERATR